MTARVRNRRTAAIESGVTESLSLSYDRLEITTHEGDQSFSSSYDLITHQVCAVTSLT